MKNNFALVLVGLLFGGSLYAQQGLGTSTPNPQAALDIESPDKGLLIPRLSLTSTSTFAPISGTVSTSHNGLLVYNINPAITNGLTGEGFYVWQGGDKGYWNRLTTQDDAIVSGTSTHTTLRWDGTHWVENAALQSNGNLNSTPTLFINGLENRVGIGTSTPTVPFQVIGEGDFNSIYISDNSTVSGIISSAGTSTIDDEDWVADQVNGLWYLNRLSDNNTLRSGGDQIVITDSGYLGLGTNTPDDQLEVTGSAQIAGALKDSSGDAGTAGQVLSTTGNGLDWVNAATSNTDSQTLGVALNGDNLDFTLTNAVGQSIDLSGYTNTDSQTLSFSPSASSTETTLAIVNGNSLSLQASGTVRFSQTGTNTLSVEGIAEDTTLIVDEDGDTQVQVEKATDEDIIRMDAGGIEVASFTVSDTTFNTPVVLTDTLEVAGTTTLTNNLAVQGATALTGTTTQVGNLLALAKIGIGVNSINASATLEVNGDVYATNMHLSSDARYKTNITTLTNALELVLQLRGVKHDWVQYAINGKTFSQESSLGLIAQELEQHVPELVRTDAQGYKTVDYAKLSALLIEAIKTQQKQLQAQEIRLRAIEKKLNL